MLSTESKLLQEAHLDNIKRCKRGQTSWIRPITFLLEICGMTQIDIVDISKRGSTIMRETKKKLRELYVQHWQSEARDRKEGKMAFYLDMKKNFHFEKYLDNIPRSERKAITRLRLSCHTLPVEILRYHKTEKIERSERKCTLCTNKEVGDEWHYLANCKNNNISKNRAQFMEKIITIQPQLKTFELHTLMHYCVSLQDTSIQTETAKFVNELLDTYSEEKREQEKKEENNACSIM